MTGVFPSVLKTEKVVSVFKKDSKLDYCNYRPTFMLSYIRAFNEYFVRGRQMAPVKKFFQK